MATGLEANRRPHESLSVIVQAIDLHWDNLLEYPQNTIQVSTRDTEENGRVVQEIFTIQRIYDTAYWIKCDRAELSTWGGQSPIMKTPLNSIEFRLMPTLLEKGKISLRITDASTSLTTDTEIPLDNLKNESQVAAEILSRLELNLLALLVGHCQERPIFDPLPITVKGLLQEAYGREMADELWRTGMEK